jgi:hypothetical protein
LPLVSPAEGNERVSRKKEPSQLELPLYAQAKPARVEPPAAPARPSLKVIQGGGARTFEKLASRDAVIRVLVEAGADLLLRRISPERNQEIERKVDRVLRLFDQVDGTPELMPVLKRQLDDLEALMRETREGVALRRRGQR